MLLLTLLVLAALVIGEVFGKLEGLPTFDLISVAKRLLRIT